MEGISVEATGLAGHWGLGKLIFLYDDNRMTTLDGESGNDLHRRYCKPASRRKNGIPFA